MELLQKKKWSTGLGILLLQFREPQKQCRRGPATEENSSLSRCFFFFMGIVTRQSACTVKERWR